MVGIVVNTTCHECPKGLLRRHDVTVLQHHRGGTFAQIQPQPLGIKGTTRLQREGMKSVKTRQDEGRLHVNTTDNSGVIGIRL